MNDGISTRLHGQRTTPAEQLHAATVWYLEEGSAEAREAVAAAAARFEIEGDELRRLVAEAVDERDERAASRDGLPISEWHAAARRALGRV